MGDLVKEVIAEWVLTNGSLPGFQQKVIDTHTHWDSVGSEGMTVYRGQGGKITPVPGTIPESLRVGVRPVLATSTNSSSILPYTGDACCIFRIKLERGTRILGVKRTVTDPADTSKLYVKGAILKDIATRCAPENWSGRWPNPNTPYSPLKKAMLDRCESEDEIMVYFLDGTITEPVLSSDTIGGKTVYDVTYTPPASAGSRISRGRTFRRTSRRRNKKNGGRSARQSKHHVGNRNA
jgi:hypothetical protein